MVRLIPQVCPISPQRRMNRSCAVVSCCSTVPVPGRPERTEVIVAALLFQYVLKHHLLWKLRKQVSRKLKAVKEPARTAGTCVLLLHELIAVMLDHLREPLAARDDRLPAEDLLGAGDVGAADAR